jgi:hypothetical protein
MVTSTDPREEIRSMIARVRGRWLVRTRLATAGVALSAMALPVALAVVVGRMFGVSGPLLLALLSAAVIAGAAGASLSVRRMQRRPSDREVARFIEERIAVSAGDPSLEDHLVSAVDVTGTPGTPGETEFSRLILIDAARRLRDLDPAAILSPQSLRRAGVRAGVGAALLLATFIAAVPLLGPGADAARLAFFPASVQVDVLPGNVRIPTGAPLRLKSVVRGQRGPLSDITAVLTMTAGADRRTVSMTHVGGAFEYLVPAVDGTFSYQVSAGRARSANYTVTALSPPRVTRIDLSYVYPSFAGLASREEQDGGDIYAPSGTRVRLRVHADKPVAAGELTLGGTGAVPLRPTFDGTAEAEIVVAREDSYRVSLADRDGLHSGRGSQYFIRIMDDRPPTVRVLRPSSDQQITPLEEIAIEARADDDYGVAAFDLVYAVGGGAPRTVPFTRVSGTPVERVGSTLLSAEALGVKPGDVISYYARAVDVGRGKRATRATSDIFFLEVKPFTEEFVVAESAAGGQRPGGSMDNLVDAQKQIITSTWNIERRATAGRSAEDVRTIAEAQAALKSRAEQISSSRRGRRSATPAPESVMDARAGGADADPIREAVLAMGQAVEQLQTEKTADALPHEMAALNALLQAQAEARRREVLRQQANGGGNGSGRAGQDLSALFDKELQRQQQTNYETPPSAEAIDKPTDANDALFDRLRDLARRQEELSGRQADLDRSGLPPDKLQRELEKLTREQAALRQETEELAQRGGQSVRDAARQMAGATGELRRADPGAAARDGERAAAQLRHAQEQAHGSGAAATERTRADVQIEAQQVAQEQRRIAAQAERLEGGGRPAPADGRRQLADDKNRLADRVGELGRGIGETAPEAARTGSPRKELDELARRMRESARQLREGPDTATGIAPRERDLARAADDVVRRLQSSGSPDTRQLSKKLAETRAIRDRLERLEQQMRDASEAAAPAGGRDSARSGRQGGNGAGADRTQMADARRAAEEYRREIERARQALDRLVGAEATSGSGEATPEREQFSRSAPGTEAFKQDRSDWASLRKDVDLALDQYEARVSTKATSKREADRLSGGGSERVPDGYQESIAKYFESIAAVKKGKQ